MPHHPSLHRSRNLGQQHGFALLITITLLAFLVLLLVSLAALTKVEIQVAANNQPQAQARQNALLALNIALGQLQKFTGPDNVTTARADILATTPANNSNYTGFYTGVWGLNQPLDSSTQTLAQTWLVSGNESSPLSLTPETLLTTANDIVLVDKAVNSLPLLQVKVRKQPIQSTIVPGLGGTPTTLGHFAYWVGDEGIKAKINLIDPYAASAPTTSGAPSLTAPPPDPATKVNYRLSVAQRFGIEAVSTDLDGKNRLGSRYDVADNTPADFRRALLKISGYNQLNLLPGFSALTGADAFTAHRYHDLTTSSYGLLTNTANGGLREDLTWHFEPTTTSSPLTGKINVREPNDYTSANSWDFLRRYYNLADKPRPLVVEEPLRNTAQTEDSQAVEATPAPVLVQIRVFFTPQPNGHILMRLAFVVGNPYNADLQLPNGLSFTFNKASKWRLPGFWDSDLSVTNDPKATNSDRAIAATAEKLNILDQLVGGGAATTGTSSSYIYAVPGPLTFPAGEARVFTLAGMSNYPLPAGSSVALREGMDASTGIILSGTWANPNTTQLTFSSTANPVPRFQLRMWNGQTPGTWPLQRINDQPWSANATTGASGGGIQIQLIAPEDPAPAANSQNREPFYRQSFRSPLAYSQYSTGTLGNNTLSSSFWSSDQFTADLAIVVLWGNSNRVSAGKLKFMMYDIPLRNSPKEPALMSLAQLQHANLGVSSLQYASTIGNSRYWDTSDNFNPGKVTDISFLYNEVFWDRFYFSTIPQVNGEFNPAADLLPNARYVVKSSLPSSVVNQSSLTTDQYSAARHLMINGPFNINSTSVEAWKALLGSTRQLALNGETTNVPYFRTIRQSGKSKDARDLTKDDAWSGYINLTDAEINNLATKMVAQVKGRGPFNSLANFVNRKAGDPTYGRAGTLQAAIDEAGLNVRPTTVPGNQAYTGIPGFLMQADILQALGPVLTSRSDTFTIRAYGESINPLDSSAQPTAKAYGEAVVQRLQDPATPSGAAPALVGGTPPDYITTPGTMGRRFKIVSFRWLTPNDI